MKSIADELALAQNPILEEDLVVHILSQLGDEFDNIVAAIRVRESPISFSELFDKLTDFERLLKDNEVSQPPILATANLTQRSRFHPHSKMFSGNSGNSNAGFSNSRKSRDYNGSLPRQHQSGPRSNRSDRFCQFCGIPGHNTRDCRKLARFLKENNIHISNTLSHNPMANATMLNKPSTTQQPWLFDSGASDHATSYPSMLQTFSNYGGLDEIFLGDGKSLSISHTGNTTPTLKFTKCSLRS